MLVYADYLAEQGQDAEEECWRFLADNNLVGRWCENYESRLVQDSVSGRYQMKTAELETGYWSQACPDRTSTSVLCIDWWNTHLDIAMEFPEWADLGYPPPGSMFDLFHPVRARRFVVAAYVDCRETDREEWRLTTLKVRQQLIGQETEEAECSTASA